MKLKPVFRLFLLLVIFVLYFPVSSLAANKCGVNISLYYGQTPQVNDLIPGSGGWVVAIGLPADATDQGLGSVFGNDLNVVVRGHAGWAMPLEANSDFLDQYAFNLILNLSAMDTKGQALYLMPVNEPNMTGEADYLSEQFVMIYINYLNKWIEYFEDQLGGSRIFLISPMINQSHHNYETYLGNLTPSGYSFYSGNDFKGSSQNVYDYQECGSVFCNSGPKFNARDYAAFKVPAPNFAVEAGVVDKLPGEANSVPYYEDSHIAELINKGMSSSWNSGPLKMFAVFSHDPLASSNSHAYTGWDIFDANLTKKAYSDNCKGSEPIEPDGYQKRVSEVIDEIKAEIPWELDFCDSGAYSTGSEFCETVGGGGSTDTTIDPQPYKASRWINANHDYVVAESDPVLFSQQVSLSFPEETLFGHFGADFLKFEDLVIPWARVITKFLAGPYVFDGNTKIRQLLNSGELTEFRPLTDLTTKEQQDKLRFEYWTHCADNDPCNPQLHCHGAVPTSPSLICEESEVEKCPDETVCCPKGDEDCTDSYVPCFGKESNECLLSNGKEMRINIPEIPPKFDPGKDPLDPQTKEEQKQWEKKYKSYWAEVPLMANPNAKANGAIRMASCMGESGASIKTYTPWVSALKSVSLYLNTMLSPSGSAGEEKKGFPVPPSEGEEIGEGGWTETEENTYCSNGKETVKILYNNTPASFVYEAVVEMAQNTGSAGLTFRTSYQPDPNPYKKYKSYSFNIKGGSSGSIYEWMIQKTQMDEEGEEHCSQSAGCFCVDGKTVDCNDVHDSTKDCDCSNKNDLYALNNPMVLANGSLSLSKSDSHKLKVEVTNTSEGVLIIAYVDDNSVGSYTDKYHPYYEGSAGVSVYNGDSTSDNTTCFHSIRMDMLSYKKPFIPTALKLINQDLNNFKQTTTDIKTNLTKPIVLAQNTWEQNSTLPNYKKIEKVLLAGRQLFQPPTNLLAQAKCFHIEMDRAVFNPTGSSEGTFTVWLKVISDGCDGHIQFWVDDTETGLGTPGWNGENPYVVDPEWNNSPFSVPLGETIKHKYSVKIDECNECNYDELTCSFTVSKTPTGDLEGKTNCSDVIPVPPGPTAAPLPGGKTCQPPAVPTFKPDGPSDPIMVDAKANHTIFDMGTFELSGKWEPKSFDPVTGLPTSFRCVGNCGDGLTVPVWARVKYPFLETIYNQTSNLTNGLFAKFLPYMKQTYEPDYEPLEWDVAGESDISYCVKDMKDTVKEAAGAGEDTSQWAGFWPEPNVRPYPGRNGNFSNALCSSRTQGLKVYPQFIGGVSNAAEWLVCTLNPAGSLCADFLDNQEGIPEDTEPERLTCYKWPYFCDQTLDDMWDENGAIRNEKEIINHAEKSWPESNINTIVGSQPKGMDPGYDFMDVAIGEWADASSSYPSNTPLKSFFDDLVNNRSDYEDITWLDFVIKASRHHGWNPRMVITLWMEESGASAYGHWDYPVQDLGCGVGKNYLNLPGNLTCLFTSFEDLKAENDWESFILRYRSRDEELKGCFNYPEFVDPLKTFPGRICSIYNYLGGGAEPALPESDLIDVYLIGDSSYVYKDGQSHVTRQLEQILPSFCNAGNIASPDAGTFGSSGYKIWDSTDDPQVKAALEFTKNSKNSGHQPLVVLGFGANESKDIASNKNTIPEFITALTSIKNELEKEGAKVVFATSLKGCPNTGKDYEPDGQLKQVVQAVRANFSPVADIYSEFDSTSCSDTTACFADSPACDSKCLINVCDSCETADGLGCRGATCSTKGCAMSDVCYDESCQQDYAHPNKKGVEIMAETIKNAIVSTGLCY